MTAPLISIYMLHWPDLLRRLDEFAGVLSMDEQERASRFHFDQDRQRFILCRAWLRCILGEHLAMPPHAVTFRLGSHGKPAVDGPWQFNLSHSGTWALCAVARGLPVGVDIEMFREMADAEELAERFFTPCRGTNGPCRESARAWFLHSLDAEGSLRQSCGNWFLYRSKRFHRGTGYSVRRGR